mmetsp:Transcript_11591/g.34695  ORF Transcript_11591/g.34695 Transcript_11591/m.34695 type:complete len:231 (+) Transcript_11591:323-1015(+)
MVRRKRLGHRGAGRAAERWPDQLANETFQDVHGARAQVRRDAGVDSESRPRSEGFAGLGDVGDRWLVGLQSGSGARHRRLSDRVLHETTHLTLTARTICDVPPATGAGVLRVDVRISGSQQRRPARRRRVRARACAVRPRRTFQRRGRRLEADGLRIGRRGNESLRRGRASRRRRPGRVPHVPLSQGPALHDARPRPRQHHGLLAATSLQNPARHPPQRRQGHAPQGSCL